MSVGERTAFLVISEYDTGVYFQVAWQQLSFQEYTPGNFSTFGQGGVTKLGM